MPRIIDLITKTPSKEDYVLIGNGSRTLNDVAKLLSPHPEFQIVHLAKEEKVIRNDPFVYILLDGTDYRNTEYAKIHNYFKEIVSVAMPSNHPDAWGNPVERLPGRFFVDYNRKYDPNPDGTRELGEDEPFTQPAPDYNFLIARANYLHPAYTIGYIESSNDDNTVNVFRLAEDKTYTLSTIAGLDLSNAVGLGFRVNWAGEISVIEENASLGGVGVIQQINSDGTVDVAFKAFTSTSLDVIAKIGEPTFQPGDIPNLTDQPYMLKLNNDVVGVKEMGELKEHIHYVDTGVAWNNETFEQIVYEAESIRLSLSTDEYITTPLSDGSFQVNKESFSFQIDDINHEGPNYIIPSSKIINFYCKMKLD
ncbi:MAG: hypothetical protein LBH40_00735 [Alphaproteobacteria bacterium]|jgi:hypothetical protein|nr:hypothetical protein [Alphaproteobacteria bacterium]